MTTTKEPTVYTLYLDSCGDSGWCAPCGKSTVRYYVVAGLALTGSADLKAQDELECIVMKYAKSKVELLYHDLIRGKGSFEGIEDIKRKEMADEIFALLAELKPVLFATVVDKVRMKTRYGIDAHDPKLYGMRATIGRFSMFLRNQTNGIGNVVMDAEEVRKDRLIQEMIRTFKVTGTEIRGWNYQPKHVDTLDRILNTITFADSSITTGIQLADVCCRTVWQNYQSGKGRRFEELHPYWNRDNITGRIYEPSLVPK
jgi:hypothetical protein